MKLFMRQTHFHLRIFIFIFQTFHHLIESLIIYRAQFDNKNINIYYLRYFWYKKPRIFLEFITIETNYYAFLALLHLFLENRLYN